MREYSVLSLLLVALGIFVYLKFFADVDSVPKRFRSRRRRNLFMAKYTIGVLITSTMITLIWPWSALPGSFQGAVISTCICVPVYTMHILTSLKHRIETHRVVEIDDYHYQEIASYISQTTLDNKAELRTKRLKLRNRLSKT